MPVSYSHRPRPDDRYNDVGCERNPLNNSARTVDTTVSLRQPKSGCYVTKLQVGLFILILVLIIAFVGLMIAFVGRYNPDCKCAAMNDSVKGDDTESEHTETSRASTGETSKKPSTTSITRSTAANIKYPWKNIRLPLALIPVQYDIVITVNLTKFNISQSTFKGSVKIIVEAAKTTSYVILHSNLLTIDETSVRVYNPTHKINYDIVRQFYEPDNQFYVIELLEVLPAGHTYVIDIGKFSGKIMDDLRGLYYSSYKTSNGETRYMAASQLQSTDARKVFPCFDEPAFKARFIVSIIHQPEYISLSNMPRRTSTTLPGGWMRDDFGISPAMSTYLLAFIVADFKYKEAMFPNGFRIRVWAQPDLFEQTDYALNFAVHTYNFFTEYFDTSEVVPKADHVAVPDFSGGAMENWGLVIYRETALLYDPQVSSSSNKYMVTLIVAHEIAHTWFGNMATMKWWDDLWLNEGFASILMYIAMDNENPNWNVFAIQVVEDIFPVMVKDSLTTSHPISTPIVHPDEIAEYFDTISYNKGMGVLRMLQSFVGRENFQKALQIYVRRYKFKNAGMEELWETFTEAADNRFNVLEIMDTWTRQMGYPVIQVTSRDVRYRLDQKRFLLDPESTNAQHNPLGYKWYVPFTYITQEDPGTVKLEWLNLRSSSIPKRSMGWILGNIDYVGIFRVNYEPDMWRQLTKQLKSNHTVFRPANRAGLIGDAFNLARAGQLDYHLALNVSTYLVRENNYVPWKAFIGSVEFLRGILSTREAYGLLEKYLRKLVEPVFVISTPKTLPEKYLRRLILEAACEYGVPRSVKYARSMFQAWKQFGSKLPTDYAFIIYTIGIQEGSEEDWEHLWNQSQASNIASEREVMMDALARTRNPWLLWRYIGWVFDSSKIKMQDVRLVVGYFSKTSLGRMIARQFMLTNWIRLIESFGHDYFLLRGIITETTAYVNTDYELNQIEVLFKNHPPPGAKNAAETAIALGRANIKWMQKNYDIINNWLKHQNR